MQGCNQSWVKPSSATTWHKGPRPFPPIWWHVRSTPSMGLSQQNRQSFPMTKIQNSNKNRNFRIWVLAHGGKISINKCHFLSVFLPFTQYTMIKWDPKTIFVLTNKSKWINICVLILFASSYDAIFPIFSCIYFMFVLDLAKKSENIVNIWAFGVPPTHWYLDRVAWQCPRHNYFSC